MVGEIVLAASCACARPVVIPAKEPTSTSSMEMVSTTAESCLLLIMWSVPFLQA